MANHIAPAMVLLRASVAEEVGGWSTFILAWLAILALPGTLLGVAQSRRDARRARTLDYLRRFNGEEFAPLNTKVLTFLATADPNAFAGAAKRIKSVAPATKGKVGEAFEALDIETQALVTLVLNFYEELSCSYREDLLDESVAAKMLVPTLAYAWKTAEPFVAYGREQARKWQPPEVANNLMREWEALYLDPGPPSKSWDWLGRLEGTAGRLLGAVALALAIGSLVAIGVAAAANDVPGTVDSFLVALAAAFAVLAVIALTPVLSRARSPRGLLLTAALTGTLAVTVTAGLTVGLDLTSSVGPAGPTGPGGASGLEGLRGPTGPEGSRGSPGEHGHGGKRGPTGPRGMQGPTGPRGYPGYPDS